MRVRTTSSHSALALRALIRHWSSGEGRQDCNPGRNHGCHHPSLGDELGRTPYPFALQNYSDSFYLDCLIKAQGSGQPEGRSPRRHLNHGSGLGTLEVGLTLLRPRNISTSLHFRPILFGTTSPSSCPARAHSARSLLGQRRL